MKFKNFKNLLKNETEYEILEEYDDNKEISSHDTKIKILHKKCNNFYNVSYHDFSNKRRCPYCNGRYRTTKMVKDEMFKLTNGEYELLNEYISCKEKLLIKHNICKKTFQMKYGHFFGSKKNHLGNRCPYCSHGHLLKSIEEVKNEIKNISNNEYEVLSEEYFGNKIPIKIKHKSCGNIFEMRFNGFQSNGYRCPICATKSKGEDKIINYLNEHNIDYKRQYRISDCKDKKPLPFDFCLNLPNNKIILIEYNGIQHYIPNGSKPFAKQILKDHDKIKEEYCKRKNIELVSIPYTDIENIENILKEIISSTIPNGEK